MKMLMEILLLCKDPSEVWDDGLQIHGKYSHGDRSEEAERL
jgi:hypothetical protein